MNYVFVFLVLLAGLILSACALRDLVSEIRTDYENTSKKEKKEMALCATLIIVAIFAFYLFLWTNKSYV